MKGLFMKRNRKLLCALLVLALCLLTAWPAAAWAETAEDLEPPAIELEDEQTPEPEDAPADDIDDEDEPEDAPADVAEDEYEPEDAPAADADDEDEPEDADSFWEEPEDARFFLHTPENLTIVFGLEWQSIGFVSVSDVTGLWEGERILLYTDGAAFVNLDDPYETIPFAITDAWGNDVICLYDEELGEQAVELFISISPDAWDRAAVGSYAATLQYHAVVE